MPRPKPEGSDTLTIDDAVLQAEEADAVEAEVMDETMPDAEFSAKALNEVIDVVNQLGPAFGLEPYPPVEEDGQISPELFQTLTMIMQAAQDMRFDDAVVDLTTLSEDQDLMLLAGALQTLADSREFLNMLGQPTEAPEATQAQETQVVEDTTDTTPTDAEMDELFLSRI